MDNWIKKQVVVTGGSGFLGGAVVRLLREAGASVYAPTSEEVDLRYPSSLLNYISKLEMVNKIDYIDTVIHLAGMVGGISAVSRNPYSFMHTNLLIGVNVINDSIICGVDSVIYSNSVCAYPKKAPVPTTEDMYWEGKPEDTNAPYGVAKKAIGELLLAARAQYGIKSANLVFANMYGPRDNFDPVSSHVIPSLIRRMSEAKRRRDKTIEVWGSGKPTRDFLYVEDAARAVLASTSLDHPSHLNVAAGEEWSIEQVVSMICEATGYDGEVIWNRNMPDGQPRRRFDSSAFSKLTGWEASTKLNDGILKTVSWYESVFNVKP